MKFLEALRASKIVGIVRGIEHDELGTLADGCKNAGLGFIEITMNTPDAANKIRALTRMAEGAFRVGAGTVLTVSEFRQAVDAGYPLARPHLAWRAPPSYVARKGDMDSTALWLSKAQHQIPWTTSEAREAVAAWQASGQSLGEFAKAHGIAWQRLAQAKSRVLKMEQPCRPAIFLPVTVGEVPTASAKLTIGALTIEVASLESVSPAWLAQLIAACESPR